MPQLFIVHAASLDDPSQYKPQFVTYASRAHAWEFVDPDLPAFEKIPSPAG